MGIHTKSGHLTVTEKRAITAILAAGLTEGRVGRTDYRMTKDGDTYTVRITKAETDWFGPKVRTHTYTFIVR